MGGGHGVEREKKKPEERARGGREKRIEGEKLGTFGGAIGSERRPEREDAQARDSAAPADRARCGLAAVAGLPLAVIICIF